MKWFVAESLFPEHIQNYREKVLKRWGQNELASQKGYRKNLPGSASGSGGVLQPPSAEEEDEDAAVATSPQGGDVTEADLAEHARQNASL